MFIKSIIALVLCSLLIACLPESKTGQDLSEDTPRNNQAPYFNGSLDALLQVNEEFEIQLKQFDADNDPLTYEFSNLPSWISYNVETGFLSGIPSINDINKYDNIRVSVSDGVDTIIAGPYTIEVVMSLYSASIEWTPVTQNQDNETISNIEGYKIMWGSNSGLYSSNIIVEGQNTSQTFIHRLKTGNYFFVMKALLPSGFEGPLSDEFEITISENI